MSPVVQLQRLVIPKGMTENIRAHADEYCDGEVVGIIGGRFDGDDRRIALMMARAANRASNPRHHFRVDPFDQYRIEKAFEKKGCTMIGLYHSHVHAQPIPSENDKATIPPSLFSLIYSVKHEALLAWSGDTPVEMEVRG
jgi:proteasome lid subunit RPN8/RPN11